MDYIKALGTSGSLASDRGTTCIQLSNKILIDAGNIISSLGDAAAEIEHIYLTHSHFDHITDIPAIIDLFFTSKIKTLNLYGLEETLETLKNSIFNEHIFPDFSKIDLIDGSSKTIKYHPIKLYESYKIDDITIMPFPTNHTITSCGYVIKKGKEAIMFTSDTGPCEEIYNIINNDESIKTLITEVSFPSTYEELADVSLHLTPKLLQYELSQLNRTNLRILIMHIKPSFADIIIKELNEFKFLDYNISILHDGDRISYDNQKIRPSNTSIYSRYDTLLKTGMALTTEQNQSSLAEIILKSARELTQSDAGTLYLLSDDEKYLHFQAIQNDSIKITNNEDLLYWEPIALYNDKNEEVHSLAATHCALSRKLIRIDDIYNSNNKFNFNSTILYDQQSGYLSHSMLLIPLIDYENNLIGVLQLINKQDIHNRLIAYNKDDEQVITALGSQVVISITNQKLIDSLEALFESFLSTINLALDEKSPYMKGHIHRMTKLTMLIANGVHHDKSIFKDKTYTAIELKTIQISAMMHDIGKITTPMYIMNKSKKLETIFDRIELIKLKFELLKSYNIISSRDKLPHINNDEIDNAYKFLFEANIGKEYFDEKKIKRVLEIANWHISVDNKSIPILNEDEIKNLIIQKGTLTKDQRNIINHHATMSINMLNSIHFPKKYARVPEIAGSHHEKINGTGYPNGFKEEEISFEARILAVADIFEALTSLDRSYKEVKMLSESMQIIFEMANNNEIDYTLCKFFYESGLYLEYAKKYIDSKYIDKVELNF